jgi:hypothetical protein
MPFGFIWAGSMATVAPNPWATMVWFRSLRNGITIWQQGHLTGTPDTACSLALDIECGVRTRKNWTTPDSSMMYVVMVDPSEAADDGCLSIAIGREGWPIGSCDDFERPAEVGVQEPRTGRVLYDLSLDPEDRSHRVLLTHRRRALDVH